MEVCESGGEQPPLLHWDRKLSELCEPADPETLLSRTDSSEETCLLVRCYSGGRLLASTAI